MSLESIVEDNVSSQHPQGHSHSGVAPGVDIAGWTLQVASRGALRGARGKSTVWCTCSTTSLPSSSGEVLVLRVAGEIDCATIGFFGTVLSQRPTHLIVDLAEVSFCGAGGLTVLADVAATASTHRIHYAVSAAAPIMLRCWSQLWPAGGQPIQFHTCAAALSAAQACDGPRNSAPGPGNNGTSRLPGTDEHPLA